MAVERISPSSSQIRVVPGGSVVGEDDVLLLEIRIHPRTDQDPPASPPPEPHGPILLRVEEAARTLAISRAALYPLLGREIPIVRIGRSVRVPREELKKYVADRLDGG